MLDLHEMIKFTSRGNFMYNKRRIKWNWVRRATQITDFTSISIIIAHISKLPKQLKRIKKKLRTIRLIEFYQIPKKNYLITEFK